MAIPQQATVFVTGSTGSVGGAVTTEILKAGFRVKAVVRNREKGRFLEEAFWPIYGQQALELCYHDDLTDTEMLASEMKGCAGVAHVASNISTSTDPEQVITPTVKSVTALLEAAAQTPSIKRFVYTSSLATLPKASEPIEITPSSWAPDSIIAAARSGPESGLSEMERGMAVYAASKLLAERACWDFVRERQPGFAFNAVVAYTNLGAFVHPRLVSSFNGLVLGVWLGDPRAGPTLDMVERAAGVHLLINLEDCGLLHVAALTLPDVAGERILAGGEAFTYNDILDTMREIDPTRALPEHSDFCPAEVKANIETARYKELLARLGKPEPTGFKESIKQAITSGAGAPN
ncbi:hypothetical protein PG985_013523 [Apiospora marii]|uniref:NAD-dependent epimerase/dehydratase domain-containing protein n=1 Tax=Apiospora marii TaxID=335849 RepID=A0ABR1R7K8_9PEZI